MSKAVIWIGLAALAASGAARAEEAYVTRFRDGALLMKAAMDRMQAIDRSSAVSYCTGVKSALGQLNKAEFVLMQAKSMANTSSASAETIKLIEDTRVKASTAAGKLSAAKISHGC